MAAALAEQRDVLEEVIEPYLMQQGLVQRTPRGRVLTRGGFGYLGLDVPRSLEQLDLLSGGPLGEAETCAPRPHRRYPDRWSMASIAIPFACYTRTPMQAASSISPAPYPSPRGRAPTCCAWHDS